MVNYTLDHAGLFRLLADFRYFTEPAWYQWPHSRRTNAVRVTSPHLYEGIDMNVKNNQILRKYA